MNLYFLVEGRRTEVKVYPAWLRHLLPHYTKVDDPGAVGPSRCYYLVSGEGYPRLLDVMLERSIEDINAAARYAYFVICLDAEEETVDARREEVEARLRAAPRRLDPAVTARVIVQNRSIETWCLGNRTIFSRNPTSRKLREFAAFYDVSRLDPEGMGYPADYDNHATFHHHYLREMFAERRLAYSKRNPGHVLDKPYLDELILRTTDEPTHLATLQTFVGLCGTIHQLTA
jgi:hypothetical protein